MSDLLFDSILAAMPSTIRQDSSVTPRGKLLLPGLTTQETNQAKAIATKVAVDLGFVIGFNAAPWDEVPIFDLTITVIMTREELMARFAAMTPEGQEIVMKAARTARAAIEAGDTRPAIEITTAAVREAMKGTWH